jgi:hypothetical protein
VVSLLLSVTFACGLVIVISHVINQRFVAPVYDVVANGLVALILAFGPVSGGHFNPVVTLADRAFGGSATKQVAAYLPAQLAGGVLGAVLANLMFSLDAVSISTHHRSSGGLWLSEALATFGLVVLIFGLVRAGKLALAPFTVGAYITAAYRHPRPVLRDGRRRRYRVAARVRGESDTPPKRFVRHALEQLAELLPTASESAGVELTPTRTMWRLAGGWVTPMSM